MVERKSNVEKRRTHKSCKTDIRNIRNGKNRESKYELTKSKMIEKGKMIEKEDDEVGNER